MEQVDAFYRAFDIYVFCIVIAVNFFLFFKKPKFKLKWQVLIPWFILFFFLFPYVSAEIEAYKFHEATKGQAVDGFETLYIFARWFMYWGFGLVQLLLLFLLSRLTQNKTAI
ncbi:hypothetical protein [Balneola vulgaris]|uniref:hypothetical protein n=1 Tax=Balneola vulgaris TaxID=287535 RepID=UPI00035F4A22|nr:hypothetical protein [Balneola vulgaris]